MTGNPRFSLKPLILVISSSFLIGIGIYYLLPKTSIKNQPNSFQNPKSQLQNQKIPSPTPFPSLAPIDQNSNLEEEINKLTPPDFSKDIQFLKSQI